jgi:hypothetical protein
VLVGVIERYGITRTPAVLDYRTCCFFPSDMTQTPPSWAGYGIGQDW